MPRLLGGADFVEGVSEQVIPIAWFDAILDLLSRYKGIITCQCLTDGCCFRATVAEACDVPDIVKLGVVIETSSLLVTVELLFIVTLVPDPLVEIATGPPFKFNVDTPTRLPRVKL